MLAHPILHWEMTAMAFSTTSTFRGDGLSSEINVTPLIDVLLVMLIIFLVIVPVMPRGLDSALPSPVTPGVAEAADRPVLVQVEQGQTAVRYLVDGVGVERVEVAPRLVELLSRRSGRQVLVKGGREAGLRRCCGGDRRSPGCGSGERRIGDSGI
jgi:biopolymer transport protein TolR